MNRLATELNPEKDLKGKHNFKKFVLIDSEGNKNTRIILSVPNISLRELIICSHFISRHVCFFIKQAVGIKIISRDKPWDFELELSNLEKLIIEITSVADQEDLFKKFKYEERLVEISQYEKIELHELIKLNFNFPDREIEEKISSYRNQGLGNKNLIENPYYNRQFIFQSRLDDDIQSFEKLLKNSIEKKVLKKHSKKEEVILIVDNRTITFNLNDIIQHLENLNDYFIQLPFKEVWIYTGYYSDNDGNNAEYSLIPLKISEEKLEKLINKL